ncbi:MAG: NADH-quinone oxidoreductase subunit C [Terriglobia bacterium]
MTLPAALRDHPLLQKLRSFHPQAIAAASLFRNQLSVELPPGLLRPVCEFLKADPDLTFDFLADLTCVDRYPVEPRFELVYHLLSLKTTARLRLKARVPGENPHVDSLTGLWSAANWLEREVFDLFGIHFSGHPHLRRILMPDDWEGHPLRKDYPVEGYR